MLSSEVGSKLLSVDDSLNDAVYSDSFEFPVLDNAGFLTGGVGILRLTNLCVVEYPVVDDIDVVVG